MRQIQITCYRYGYVRGESPLTAEQLNINAKKRFAMKRSGFARVAVTLMVIAGMSLCSQGQPQDQAPHPARSRADETLEMWNAIGNKLIAMAEDFPEDKYDFKLQKDERTFALNLLHAAALDFVLIRRISGSNVGPDFGEGDNPTREQFKTKADVVKFVQEAVADGAKVIQEQGDAGLEKTTKFFGNRLAHNSYIWTSAIEHSAEHYGQLVVYYRANNLIPPDSRRNAQASQPASGVREVGLKASDGTVLKGTYFAASKPGPGVLLFHQSNRARGSWKDVAQQLAAAGINALTFDMRGYGESGGTPDYKVPDAEWAKVRNLYKGDLDIAFQYLISQPEVTRDCIGIGGAGVIGVENSIEIARRHPADVKSLVLLSGETSRSGLQFLHDSPGLPELFVVSDDDEYPPIEEAMQLLYASASSPSKKLVHYVEPEEAPWLWYEPFDIGKVPAKGGHGTDLFAGHPELSAIIVHWFVTTLLKTPGHAPADAITAAPILEEVEFGAGVAHAKQQLMDARKRDPNAQLWPEISMTTVGEGFMRERDMKSAVEVFKLNLLAYPDSADVMENMSEAYLGDGQKDLAREFANKTLAHLELHNLPASSWTDTEEYRGEIRRGAQEVLKKINGAQP